MEISHTGYFIFNCFKRSATKKEFDIRQRSTFEEQMKLIEIEKSWYEQFPVTYLNIDVKSVEEVEYCSIKCLEETRI